MAEPWLHRETGTYYLRRQIPKTWRDEFGGKQLWKRSLETKDAGEARAAHETATILADFVDYFGNVAVTQQC